MRCSFRLSLEMLSNLVNIIHNILLHEIKLHLHLWLIAVQLKLKYETRKIFIRKTEDNFVLHDVIFLFYPKVFFLRKCFLLHAMF